VSADPIVDGLNPEQLRAVGAVRGPVCILAGAGTGKTTTITRRIANQVATGTFGPNRILAVTFTDRAAGEMRRRLAVLGVRGVEARTFHSAALSQLSRAGAAPEQVLASKAVALRQIGNGLPRPYRFRPAGDLATEVEWAKNRRIAPTRYEAALDGHEPPIPADLMARVYREYERGKERRGIVDFEDLLERAIRLFEDDRDAAARFRERIHAFTVDEYQDANLLQQTLLERWLGDRDELCVVGDDYQSIYGFTGATPAYLLAMPERYPSARVVRLEENHRSSPEVLETANRLVPRLGGVGKVLRATRPAGPAPELRGFADPLAETGHVIDRIRALYRDEGVAFEEMAVLYRVNSNSEDFEEALSRAAIPFQVRGGAFLSRPAARSVLRRLRDPGATGVAELVARAARAEGMLATPEGAAGLGEQETVRQADLARLVRMGGEFDAAGEGRTAGAFVEDLRARFGAETGGRGVNLLTYHRAKGLEFDAVFLPHLEDGEMPFRRSKTDDAVEEERRLLYVGITRARRHLTLTWSAGGRTKPSRFLAELRAPSAAASPDARRPERSAASTGAPGGRPGAAHDLDPDADRAFQALRAWRLRRARADAVPPYVVFHDRTLAEIARRRPRVRADLAAVGGVGPAKLERYADEVLAILGGSGGH
jgi:DNA helicase-2/ATP-dependent DNA helicase PcrA